MSELYFDWLGRGMGLVSLQDPFHIDDDESFFKFKERLDAEIERAAAKDSGENEEAQNEDTFEDPVIAFECIGNDHSCQLQIIGNSLCTTGDDMDRFHEEQTINTLNLTLKKGKTVSGCIEMIAKAKSLGWGIVASIESAAETSDDFIAHLAVGAKVGQLKAGGLSNIEHLEKYNTLLRISGDRDGNIPYIGNAFRT